MSNFINITKDRCVFYFQDSLPSIMQLLRETLRLHYLCLIWTVPSMQKIIKVGMHHSVLFKSDISVGFYFIFLY